MDAFQAEGSLPNDLIAQEVETLRQENIRLKAQKASLEAQITEWSSQPEELDSTEQLIIDIIGNLMRDEGRATTLDIADAVALSRSQTSRYIKRLEDFGYVQRVGQRGGWRIIDK